MASSVLITGSNRGIGMEILKLYLARPRTTVISAVRDVHHSSAQDLHKLPIAAESRLIVVKIDSASLTDAQDAVQELQSKFGVTRLDTVIANAGIGRNWVSVADTTAAQVEDHISINAIGPLTLFHAVRPLLFESPTPRFVVLSSELGSLGMQKDRKIPDVAYGMSKAAVNFFVGKLHHEVPNLIAFPIHPGWVKTELGNSIAVAIGMKEAPITEAQSAAGVFEQVEKSTKAETSGNFLTYKGETVPW